MEKNEEDTQTIRHAISLVRVYLCIRKYFRDEKIKELSVWLRSVPTYSLERQPCGSQNTEAEIVEELEKIVDDYLKTSSSKKVTMTIKPAFLYKVLKFCSNKFEFNVLICFSPSCKQAH